MVAEGWIEPYACKFRLLVLTADDNPLPTESDMTSTSSCCAPESQGRRADVVDSPRTRGGFGWPSAEVVDAPRSRGDFG